MLTKFYHFNEGVLYLASLVSYSKTHKRNMDTLVIPATLQMKIIRQTHDLGQTGITNTYSTIRSKYYIPKLGSDYIESCKTCGATKETLSKIYQNVGVLILKAYVHMGMVNREIPTNTSWYVLKTFQGTMNFSLY